MRPRTGGPLTQLLKVAQVASRLELGERTIYELLRRGELKRVKIGGATRVPDYSGEQLISKLAGGDEREQPKQLSDGQLRAFHAKASDLDRSTQQPRGKSKTLALEVTAEKFGRPLTSANDLQQAEASWALDWLDNELRQSKDWSE